MEREWPNENLQSNTVLSRTDAAYVAGFVDGEGTFTIVRSKRSGRRALGWQYQPCFSVANSDLELLLSIRRTCGNGRIQSNYHRKELQHRTVYQLKFWAHQMRHLIPQLLPYLRGKQRQADILLKYLGHVKRAEGTAKPLSYWQAVENMRVEIANLNIRGNREPQVPDAIVLADSRQGNNQWQRSRGSA